MIEIKSHLHTKNVVLGMSGGVDSTTAALLLKEQGFAVSAFWFDVLGGQEEARRRAETAARELSIPFYAADVSQDFERTVITNFCEEYQLGRTPNPCVLCNPCIKFKSLLRQADELEAYYIASGHYAGTEFDEETGLWYIRRAANLKKDQSYMLYRLDQETISRLLLPLAGYSSKAEIRDIARENRFASASLPDSQEICFLPPGESYISYIRRREGEEKKGFFVDKDGNRLAEHQGLIHYTIGQRKGLGVTFGKPMYVTGIDADSNSVRLGSDEDLFTDCLISADNWFAASGAEFPQALEGAQVEAKIRYTAKPAAATLYGLPDGRVRTAFYEKQRAVTPGQSVVFYINDRVVGGGIIE